MPMDKKDLGRETGMTEDRNAMVLDNLRLAYWAAHRYHGCGINYDDLKGIALLGLVKAAEGYDSQKGAGFSPYAARVISNEILMALRREQKYQGTISLDAEVSVSEKGDKASLADMISCEERGFARVEAALIFSGVADELSEKEMAAVRLVICRDMKQSDAGRLLRVSQSMVSRRVKSGLRKMRMRLEGGWI